ncbi:hypothetical protein FAEPRAM212_02460 [Faecalibacterium prausnitzii M21/2]|uniref:Uncharacterized protein n=1 Tax=Faecalibacterium prausnitzii M21/2 TaxID=411485 RepID=A8SE87_9FIRM|nr:hypothetical protein FAEPRAM212_02460 [Faecalibacterium prausnitzii M21/2]
MYRPHPEKNCGQNFTDSYVYYIIGVTAFQGATRAKR